MEENERKQDAGFMLQAIEQDLWCMEYAGFNLLNDKNFMLQSIAKQNFRCLEYDKAGKRQKKMVGLR